MMDDLLKWIDEKENILNEKEPIPEEDYEVVQLLLEEHKVCMENNVCLTFNETIFCR